MLTKMIPLKGWVHQEVLINNDFTFNNKHDLQIHETAMGNALAYANIDMADWELIALAKCPLHPMLYRLYMVWGT
jgi:hypothetical protein